MKYKTIYADPPWPQRMSGNWAKHKAKDDLEYARMSIDEIRALSIQDIVAEGCHLWLWTTNQFLRDGFDIMKAWGFKYLAPITWVKPSGIGNYFVHRTQTLLFGYKGKCLFPLERYKPTILEAPLPKRHSVKPIEMRKLVESISPEPRIELFARERVDGWDAWGNEVESDIEL